MERPGNIRRTEIAAVLFTAIGKFLFMDYLNMKLPFIVFCISFWTIYILRRLKRENGILKHWGFQKANFKQSLKLVLPFALSAVALCFGIGFWNDSINLQWHMLILFALYPIWGTFQHFLCIALFSANIRDMKEKTLKRGFIYLLSAGLFGLIHFPDQWLMLGTFFLALFYNYIYFKERNLYILGIFHGVLGALFYYTVVGRDPFMEVFGNL
ncbi:MAG: CPBP family intramembrane glutamic endopeptidase [Bacteroidota bacterium]